MTEKVEDLEKILVVEDSIDIRGLLGEILEDAGYKVFFAETGKQALKQVEQVLPRLILLDLTLPEIDGWEVVKRLRADPKYDTTLIVALTAHATAKDRSRALSIGCSAYMSKPFDIDAMLKKVADLISNN